MAFRTRSLILDPMTGIPVSNAGEMAYRAQGLHSFWGMKNADAVQIIASPKLWLDTVDDYPCFIKDTGTLPGAPSTYISSDAKLFPYAPTNDGRVMFAQIDSSTIVGTPYAFQPFFAQKKVGMWTANGGDTTIHLYGLLNTTTGTTTARSLFTGSVLQSARRVGFVSAGTAGSSAGVRQTSTQWFRGSAQGGGYHYITRFGISQVQTNMRWFVGFTSAGGVIGNVNPSSLLNIIGFGIDSGQTTVRLFRNDGSGTASATDLGANFPATTADVAYEAGFFTYRNSTTVSVYLQRFDVAQLFTNSVSSDQPSATTPLAPQLWINNGTTAAAVAIDVIQQYIESDF